MNKSEWLQAREHPTWRVLAYLPCQTAMTR